ncbi:Transposase Tc1-like, partial [Trinorchestia longiramus]
KILDITQPAPHSLYHTTCTTQPVPHSLYYTTCTTQPAPLILRHTVCTTQPTPLILHHTACTTQPALHSLHHTACTTQPATHNLHHTACTTQPAPHSLHHSACTRPTQLDTAGRAGITCSRSRDQNKKDASRFCVQICSGVRPALEIVTSCALLRQQRRDQYASSSQERLEAIRSAARLRQAQRREQEDDDQRYLSLFRDTSLVVKEISISEYGVLFGCYEREEAEEVMFVSSNLIFNGVHFCFNASIPQPVIIHPSFLQLSSPIPHSSNPSSLVLHSCTPSSPIPHSSNPSSLVLHSSNPSSPIPHFSGPSSLVLHSYNQLFPIPHFSNPSNLFLRDLKKLTEYESWEQKTKCQNTTLNKPRPGRPRKINERAARKLVRTVVQRPQTTREELKDDLKASGIEASKHTISRALRREGLRSRTPHKTPLLQKRLVKARLKYANDHLNKPAPFLISVLWSDETKIKPFGRNNTNYVWRQQSEEYKPKCTIPTVKFGGGSIMVLGCFSSSGIDKLYNIEGTMNGRKYREILEELLLPVTSLLKLKRRWKFQEDDDLKHSANETKDWLRMKAMNILEWPSQSPDMTLIENLWRELKMKIQNRGPNNITQKFVKGW